MKNIKIKRKSRRMKENTKNQRLREDKNERFLK